MGYNEQKAYNDGSEGKPFSWSHTGDYDEEKMAHERGEAARKFRGYISSVTGSDKGVEITGTMPTWVFVLLRALGPLVLFGAIGFLTLGIVLSIIFLAYLIYMEYFNMPQKSTPPDLSQREDFRKWYKEMFNKDI